MKQMRTYLAIGIFLMMVASAAAAGVSSEYWKGANEKPLYVSPGETKDISFTLQNMVGSDDVSFKAEIINGSSIARIIDTNQVYAVPIGTKDTKVNIRISIPQSAKIGDRYNVGASFSTLTGQESGQFKIGSAFEEYFDVIVVEKAPEAKALAASTIISSTTLYIILGCLVLIIIIIAVVVKKKSRKQI
ncbi:hypothetical protein KW787_02960 [Candidatus Pacearchaeota archaeon]|nr:hypothetical protein [Candidatus Pacearchaeota archaeon]